MTKLFITLVIGVVLGYGWSFIANNRPEPITRATADIVHTMRVWEDGSYNIEYKDGTSESGCLPTGLCQD